jgi:hypothetical protein
MVALVPGRTFPALPGSHLLNVPAKIPSDPFRKPGTRAATKSWDLGPLPPQLISTPILLEEIKLPHTIGGSAPQWHQIARSLFGPDMLG